LGLQLGYISNEDTNMLIKPLVEKPQASGNQTAAKGNATMAKQQGELQQAREQTKNGLHLAAVIHAEPRYLCESRMILHATAPAQRWQSEKSHELRGRQAGREFLVEMACGRSLIPTLNEMAKPFKDLVALTRIGFEVESLVTDSRFSKVTLDDPLVAAQDELARKLGTLSLNLMRRWVLVMGLYCYQYPSKFFQLLDPELKAKCLQDMKAYDAAWHAVKESRIPWCKRLARLSMMQQTFTADVFRVLRDVSFQHVPDALQVVLERLSMTFATSAVVENLFNKGRRAESQTAQRLVTNADCWMVGTCEGVLPNLYKFREIDSSVVQVVGPTKDALPDTVFNPKVKDASMKKEFKGLPGTGPPSWPSWSAQTAYGRPEEMMASLHLHGNDKLQDGCRMWRTHLLWPGLLVKHASKAQWFFSLGTTQSLAAWLWPAVRQQVGKSFYWGFKEIKDLSELWHCPVTAVEEWKVLPTKHISLLTCFIMNNKKWPTEWPTMCVQVGAKEVPLLEHAAKNGFGPLKRAILTRICKEELKIGLDGMVMEEDILVQGICKAAKCSEEEAANILERSTLLQPRLAEEDQKLLGSVEVADCMKDTKEIDEFVNQQADVKSFSDKIAKKIRSIRVAAASKKSASSKLKAARKPISMPGDEAWSDDLAQLYMPPGGRIKRSEFDARWRCWYGPVGDDGSRWSCSKSWGWTGDENTVVESLLRASWARHTALTGEACNITGLFA
jgi:hypothetical protein